MADKLTIRNLGKTYTIQEGWRTQTVQALVNVNLSVQPGEFVSIIGPSGCGKSTLLMIVAGLHLPSEGEILVNGRRVEGPGMDRGLVFQEFALFPWMTVERNICLGLEMKGVPHSDQRAVAQRFIDMVGLRGFEKTYPFRLSGGMKQRVAVARALAYEPEVLLMDEPFGQVDAMTRGQLQNMLIDVWERTGTTILFVTHSTKEALLLSDRVVVLSGRPGTVIESLTIDLPRPRVPYSHGFLDCQERLARLLGGVEDLLF